MPDARFFESLGPLTLRALAEATGSTLRDAEAAERLVVKVAPLGQASADAVAFLGSRKHAADLATTKAGAVFVSEADVAVAPAGCVVLISRAPQAAWAKAAALLHRPRTHPLTDGMIDPTAEVEDGAEIGPGVIIGPGARIGSGTRILSAAVIGPGVAIGRGGWIGAYASIGFALIGDRVNIMAGARVGEAGFGVTASDGGLADIPQLGRVIIQDNVTVGANSCIDRGSYDDTVIGENTKLDNLVHVGHSTRLGRNCVAAAYTGISGSVVAGDNVSFGGRAGISDHVQIGDGANIAAGSGVLGTIPAGETWGGYPAKPIRKWMRETATLTQWVEAERVRGSRK